MHNIIWLLTLGSQHKWTNSKTARADIDNNLRNFIDLKFLFIASLCSANRQVSLMTWIPQGFTIFYTTAIKWFLQTDKKTSSAIFWQFLSTHCKLCLFFSVVWSWNFHLQSTVRPISSSFLYPCYILGVSQPRTTDSHSQNTVIIKLQHCAASTNVKRTQTTEAKTKDWYDYQNSVMCHLHRIIFNCKLYNLYCYLFTKNAVTVSQIAV